MLRGGIKYCPVDAFGSVFYVLFNKVHEFTSIFNLHPLSHY